MSFPSGITSQQYTDIRDEEYEGKLYVLKTPQSIVFQATVADAISNSDYAEIEFDTPSTGAYTDIKDGMTVLVHEDSSDIDDVRFPPTYSRKTATSDTIYIGWQATDLDGDDTITVLDDYRLHVRQVRANENAVFIDYDKTFVKLPPAISGLQSVYAVNSGSASSISFAPTVVAMENGASISSYTWDVGDGTITTGTSSTKDITVSFPAYSSGATSGWRQVSFTATDDNSQSTTFTFQVFVGDFRYAEWVVNDVYGINIGHNRQEGSIGSLTVGDSASTFYRDNHIAIVCEESAGGSTLTPVVNNIVFVGRIKDLVDEDIAEWINEELGQIGITQSTTYELQGYQAELALLPMPAYQLLNVVNSVQWNEVSSATIDRAIWYVLVWLTTAPNYICFDLNSSVLTDYENKGFSFENGNALDSIQDVADLQGHALTFARDGQARLRKDARLVASGDRSSLDTVASFGAGDLFRISYNEPPQQRIGKAEATSGSLNTTTSKVSLLRGQAPKIPNTIGESVRVTDYLLAKNQTPAQQVAELSTLIANFLALKNDVRNISFDVLAGYWFLIADNNVWLTVAYANFQSGKDYTTSTRWVIDDVVLSLTVERDEFGRITQKWQNSLNIRFETIDEGTANSFAFAPQVMPYEIPDNTIMFPYGSNGNPANNYGDGQSGLGSDNGGDYDQPVNPPYEDTPVSGTEKLRVPMFNSGGVSMQNATELGETYSVVVTGWTGQLGAASSTVSLLNGDGQGDSVAGISGIDGGWAGLGGNAAGSYNAGADRYEAESEGAYAGDPNDNHTGGAILVTVANPENVTSIVVTYESNTDLVSGSHLIRMYDTNIGYASEAALDYTQSGGDGSISYNGALSAGADLAILYRGRKENGTNYCYITSITINYGEGDEAYDAFYSINPAGEGTVLGSNEGLHLNDDKVTVPSGYNSMHKYENITFTGTGSAIDFSYLLDDYAGVPNGTFLLLDITGPGL